MQIMQFSCSRQHTTNCTRIRFKYFFMKNYIRNKHEILRQCPVESDGIGDILKYVFNRHTAKTF